MKALLRLVPVALTLVACGGEGRDGSSPQSAALESGGGAPSAGDEGPFVACREDPIPESYPRFGVSTWRDADGRHTLRISRYVGVSETGAILSQKVDLTLSLSTTETTHVFEGERPYLTVSTVPEGDGHEPAFRATLEPPTQPYQWPSRVTLLCDVR